MTTFSIVEDASVGASGVSAGVIASVKTGILAAAELWNRYFTQATFDIKIELKFADLSGSTLATGGSGLSFSGFGGPGFEIWKVDSTEEYITGGEVGGSDIDITITIDTPKLLAGDFFFDPAPFSRTAAVPAGKDDFISIMLHEFGHGFGYLSFSTEGMDTVDPGGSPDEPDITPFDLWVDPDAPGGRSFVGPVATALFGGDIILDPGSDSHLADSGSGGFENLMDPSLLTGTRAYIAPIHVAIFEDIGLPIRKATGGADTLFGFDILADTVALLGGDDFYDGLTGADSVNGGDGDDTLKGSAGDDTLLGGAGADDLIGDAGADFLAGGAGTDSILGGAGGDVIFGGSEADTLSGGSGADSITGVTGDDLVSGGAGMDTLYGGDGDDTITGGDDGDLLFGNKGLDSLFGGAGSDTLDGGDFADFLTGFTGDDIVAGSLGSDTAYGGDGDDTVVGGDGSDAIFGNSGMDELFGGAGSDTADGGFDSDLVAGDSGADTLSGNTGDDTVFGGLGDDVVVGGDGADSLFGNAGMDSLFGGAGSDTLSGGDGADLLAGNAGDDTILGGKAGDTLIGAGGLDSLVGGDGADSLVGNTGDDTLVGGAGDDTLIGGDDDDSFVFSPSTGDDVIIGFVAGAGTDDVITLAGIAGISSFGDVLAAATDVLGDVVIDLGGGNSLTIEDVTTAMLASDDFLFT